jgi:hypothetical protein
MKKAILILFLLVFAGIFAANKVYAQAVVSKDGNVSLVTDYETVPSATYMWVKTPKKRGSRLLKLTWQLSEENPLIPEKGVRKISVGGWLATDVQTLVFPDGLVKGVFHVNGAGDTTPNPGNK